MGNLFSSSPPQTPPSYSRPQPSSFQQSRAAAYQQSPGTSYQQSTVISSQRSTVRYYQQPTTSSSQHSRVTPSQSSVSSNYSSSSGSGIAGNLRPSQSSASSSSRNDSHLSLAGNQQVKHCVNDYLIPKSKGNDDNITEINVPFRKLVDRYRVYVCPQYNSREGCHAAVCRRFHVCYYWVQEKCKNTFCPYDHSFDAVRNNAIVSILLKRKDVNMNSIMEVLRNYNHRFNKKSKRNINQHLCMYSIMNRCNQNNCSLVHANRAFVWEVKDKHNNWLKLAFEQSNVLEELYCQPEQDIVVLPPPPDVRALQKVKELMSDGSNWQVDFSDMVLQSDNFSHDVRRLSTPSDLCCLKSMNRLATRWVWYWQDDSGVWRPYTDGCSSKFFIVGLSDHLEYHYNFGDTDEVDISVGNCTYTINVSNMTQLNKETRQQRSIQRRPVFSVLEDRDTSIYFDKFFSSSQELVRHKITSGHEFSFVKCLMEASLPTVTLLSVERVINYGIWKKYQNKKQNLKILYQDDLSCINEQYLFHGTNHSAVDLICKENFDWRLYGDNVGNLYGHGVYFSNLASMSSSYGDTNSLGIRVMFVALVLVGTMAIGDINTKIPPKNEKTGSKYDTTCNDRNDSKVFVKYNRDEYYPAYIAYYRIC